MRDFRKLEIWSQSLAFVKSIYEITGSLPGYEKLGSSFELETQIEICSLVSYINSEQYSSLIDELHILQKRMNMLREKVRE